MPTGCPETSVNNNLSCLRPRIAKISDNEFCRGRFLVTGCLCTTLSVHVFVWTNTEIVRQMNRNHLIIQIVEVEPITNGRSFICSRMYFAYARLCFEMAVEGCFLLARFQTLMDIKENWSVCGVRKRLKPRVDFVPLHAVRCGSIIQKPFPSCFTLKCYVPTHLRTKEGQARTMFVSVVAALKLGQVQWRNMTVLPFDS
jgi:hypothetical protein